MVRKHDMRRVEKPKPYNPYTYHRPDVLRYRGSVVNAAIGPALVVTAVAAAVTACYMKTSLRMSIPNTFTPILSIVVGLLLTYRTNTAYDRYWEGRRLWSSMTIAIRNLTRVIWVSVKDDNSVDQLIGKKTAINLLVGYAVAVKHYLREEEGTDYDDLKGLISNIKSTLPGFEPLEDQGLEQETIDPDHKVHHHNHNHHRYHGEPIVNHNLPLEITIYLSTYIHSLNVNVPTANSMISSLNMLVDCLSNFERILRTPIPLAYSIHLNHVLWIYCFSLPFQLVSTTGWSTIPVVFLCSFILIGIEKIGTEIENPFGYDDNDLEVDDFCGIIKQEIDNITSRPPPKLEDWIFTKENHPFENEKSLNAVDARKKDLDEVRSILSVTTNREDANEVTEDVAIKVENEG